MSKLVAPFSVFAASFMMVFASLKAQASHQDTNTHHAKTQKKTQPASVKQAAHANPRYKTESFKTVESIEIASSKTKVLTNEQMKTLKTYVDSTNILVRVMVMAALRNAGPEQAQSAAAIARKGFDSDDSMTRTYALTTLDRLDVPDILPVAKSMLADPSHFVTQEAHKILKRRGAES